MTGLARDARHDRYLSKLLPGLETWHPESLRSQWPQDDNDLIYRPAPAAVEQVVELHEEE